MLEKHFENARIKANTSILIEKVVDLQGELARVKEEKVLVEKNNSNLERQIAQQQRQLSKLKRENDKMTKRIANLEEEKNVAKLDEATSMNFDGVLLSGEDRFVRMYSLKTGASINNFTGFGGVTCIDIVSEDLLFASTTTFSISVWNLTRNELLNTLVGHTVSVVSFALLSTNWLASGSTNAEIRIWNIETGNCLRIFVHYRYEGRSWAVLALVQLPNGMLASGSECGSIKVSEWKLNYNTPCLKDLNTTPHLKIRIHCLVILPRNRLASGRDDKTIQV